VSRGSVILVKDIQVIYKKVVSIRGEEEDVVRVQLAENAKKLYWNVA